nr:hypothetical protein [Neorhizobium tomejilense]
MRQLLENGELTLDEELLRERAFLVGSLRFDNENGLACVPDVAEIFHRGVIVGMTPRQFLALTPHLDLAERPQSLPYIASHQRPMGMPFFTVKTSLDSDELRVRGHEGRHRMYWIAREYGPDYELPVAMFVSEMAYRLKAREIDFDTVERISRGVYRELSNEFVDGPIFSRAFWSHGVFKSTAEPEKPRPESPLKMR